MLKVVKDAPGAFYQHYPRTAAVVTVASEGRKNAMAVAWHCPISFDPPLYGIAVAPKRYSYKMISQSGQFAINFLAYEKREIIAALGGSSGNFTDKFTEFNLLEDDPVKSEAPILRDAYAAYECAVTENRICGDHAWITGEILVTHIAENLLADNGSIDVELVNPALYLGGDLYCTTNSGTVLHVDREKFKSH